MRALLRETMAGRLLAVPRLTQRYQAADVAYVDETLAWLAGTAEVLQQLRHPSAALVASNQAKLLAARDGYRPETVTETSTRKSVRATSAIVTGEVTTVLRAQIDEIDRYLDEMTDRMAQLLAVTSAESPIPLPPTEPRERWLDDVWRSMQNGNGAAGMYGYLNARLARSDRLYVMEQLLMNMLGEAAAGPIVVEQPAEPRKRPAKKTSAKQRAAQSRAQNGNASSRGPTRRSAATPSAANGQPGKKRPAK